MSTRPKRRAAPSAKALELARHEHKKGKAAGAENQVGVVGCCAAVGHSNTRPSHTDRQVGEARGKKSAGTVEEATTTDDVEEEVAAPPAKGREEEEHAVASW